LRRAANPDESFRIQHSLKARIVPQAALAGYPSISQHKKIRTAWTRPLVAWRVDDFIHSLSTGRSHFA
jgi:hypothetical protein